MEIVLASGSPRRRKLLEQMGITNFCTLSPAIDETMTPGLSPAQQAEELSRRKATSVAALVDTDVLLISADTVVSLNGKVFGKPIEQEDAFRMLSTLSGKLHQVFTGITLMLGNRLLTRHQETKVLFRNLCPEDIRAYIATGEYVDKAGAYGIQGRGALLIEGIQGDFYNVVGLPISLLADMLRTFGVDCLRNSINNKVFIQQQEFPSG